MFECDWLAIIFQAAHWLLIQKTGRGHGKDRMCFHFWQQSVSSMQQHAVFSPAHYGGTTIANLAKLVLIKANENNITKGLLNKEQVPVDLQHLLDLNHYNVDFWHTERHRDWSSVNSLQVM